MREARSAGRYLSLFAGVGGFDLALERCGQRRLRAGGAGPRGAGEAVTLWRMSHRADPRAVVIADRHYNRQKPGTPQFVPPGHCLVLLADQALWVTSWPFAEYVRHRWPGAWVNSLFRKEGPGLASEYIREAVAATRAVWGDPPPLGMVTFVDAAKVRRKRDPGRCYVRAGFRRVGHTEGGLVALQLMPEDMPAPSTPIGWTVNGELFTSAPVAAPAGRLHDVRTGQRDGRCLRRLSGPPRP